LQVDAFFLKSPSGRSPDNRRPHSESGRESLQSPRVTRIHRLDASLVNKIAAGEVIERPASVVKELLENAIDAGAGSIEVELVDGGATLIRVSDDGSGMPADELPLAIAPHATSKIASADDLFRVATFGFRGEALASIAAVSQVRLVSRPADLPAGAEIRASDGELEGPRPAAAPPGTTIEVRNLFFNVPARRKFLRQTGTETGHVTEQIARVALAHPHIAFRQVHQGREMRNLPATSDRRERIADFYGPELAADLFVVRRQERGLTIEGLIAPPAAARATSKWQYVMLNGRFINDRAINYAIREAYRGLVEPSRSPVVFLFLTIDPSAYDVNVHPTKIEVRWREAGLVQSQVLAILRETLLSRDLTPRMSVPSAAIAATDDPDRAMRVRAAIADFLRSAPPAQRTMEYPAPPRAVAPRIDRLDEPAAQAEPPRPAPQPGVGEAAAENSEQRAATPSDSTPTRALQVHNTYLVVESAEGVIIVDQHALHERVLYEQLRARILSGPLEAQRLLLPETLDVSAAQKSAAEQHTDLLARVGIEFSSFGPNSLAVQAFPSFMGNVDVRSFARDLLDRLAEAGHTESEETLVHRVLDMMACKAAVKAGDPLAADEIDALLAQRHLIDRSSNCPHGRPTSLSLSLRDLERQFKRT